MGELIDVRPDRFLRAMRETGDWTEACKQAGMTDAEVESLCAKNPKFDLAQVECQLEFIEDRLLRVMTEGVAKVKTIYDRRITETRDQAMEAYRNRHG